MRRLGPLLGAAFVFACVLMLGSRRFTRVEVSGHSMEPGLRGGDWLLIDRRVVASPGDIVVAFDPRARDRLIVKRVAQVTSESQLLLSSDHPAHAGELIGPVSSAEVVGRVLLRYWPPSSTGVIRIGFRSPNG